MIFGKIEYLNLLPFHVFMKRFAKTTRHHMSVNYKKGIPSKINADFHARRVDAAYISSVTARKCAHVGLGIIAKKEVKSVLLIPSDQNRLDQASATSNVLARVLGLQGEVLIGDRALKQYLEGTEAVDLAALWHERYHLPFVFALLCHHGHRKQMHDLEKNFKRFSRKIPQYLLQKASLKTGVSPKEILKYLQLISYDFDEKAQRSVKLFWRLSQGIR